MIACTLLHDDAPSVGTLEADADFAEMPAFDHILIRLA